MENDHPLDTEEVSEENITELFATDPRELSDAQLMRIIEEVRAKRSIWEQEENRARSGGKRPNARGKGLKLEDLDLDLKL